MTRLLIHWLITALCLLGIAHLVPGIRLRGFGSALLAVLVIALVNGTLGFFLKVITIPFSIITFGLFLLVINALMLMLASGFVPGFEVRGFIAAFWGALLLSLLGMVLRKA